MNKKLTEIAQNIVKELSAAGYKTQVQPLSHFYDDYGLEAGEEDGEDEEEEEDEDEDGTGGSDDSGSDEDSD